MKKNVVVWCVLLWISPTDNFRTQEMGLLPSKTMTDVISTLASTGITDMESVTTEGTTEMETTINDITNTVQNELNILHDDISARYDRPIRNRLEYAGLPLELATNALPLVGSDHELSLNVSWIQSNGLRATDYSIKVESTTDTVDCQSPLCYEYGIPGDSTWWLIPKYSSPLAESCAIRPGCAYMVQLIAHPWDGNTTTVKDVQLEECVQNVCSCGHSPRLPAPVVSAQTVVINGDRFANVSWSLPPPLYPQRLPPRLGKKSYIVSIGKQMVSDAHPAPWFANIISEHVATSGLVFDGDSLHSIMLNVTERSYERSGEWNAQRTTVNSVQREHNLQAREKQKGKRLKKVREVKLLARVTLVDDRGCIGPAGNATAFNPVQVEVQTSSFGTYAIILIVGVAWILGVVFVLSARVVKHLLRKFRSAPVTASLEIISQRPAWFPMQLRTFTYTRLRLSLLISPGCPQCIPGFAGRELNHELS